jgi:GGDEF domain-containing protein
MKDVFDEYSNPVYVIRPIVVNGVADDFEYIYVNKAFCLLLGISKNELTGHHFKEYFKEGERRWLDAFVKASLGRKHIFVDNFSELIHTKMYTEIFHVDPDMCGCIVHRYKRVADDIEPKAVELQREKNDYDVLTGFYNRFYLNEFQNEISKKENVGITYLDVNDLKRTNEEFGHRAGDELIKKMADVVRGHYGNSMIFRLDGDEFLIITEKCVEDEFKKLSEDGQRLLKEDNLATVGYKFYEKIDDLKDSIAHCKDIMSENKRQR